VFRHHNCVLYPTEGTCDRFNHHCLRTVKEATDITTHPTIFLNLKSHSVLFSSYKAWKRDFFKVIRTGNMNDIQCQCYLAQLLRDT
jgi:hypothetical protein